MKNKVLIYGASGYTGKLLAKHFASRNLSPVLAGRSDKVKAIAERLKCPVRVFPVDGAAEFLQDVQVLVNVAGPFERTGPPLIEACLQSGTHYVDIAGEIKPAATAFSYHEQAIQKGISLVPCAGFGVAPTDIAAKLAADGIPAPVVLTIAYATQGGASRGTLYTVLKEIHKPGIMVREGIQLESFPASKEYSFEVSGRRFRAINNPQRADLITAFHSTGIKNIETFSTLPGFVVRMMKGQLGWLRKLLTGPLLRLMPEGPNDRQLARGKSFVKAVVKNQLGEEYRVEVEGPEAYIFTLNTVEKITGMLMQGQTGKGVLTPSWFGTSWLGEIEGVKIRKGN